jgi:SAM-dependent methyltransferase
MKFEELDWEALERLRQQFLSGASSGPYWREPSDLRAYDATYGERIGWKWDQVLAELRIRGWTPRSRRILDWGCGSGVAARRVIAAFPSGTFDELLVWDHSPMAADFAAEAAGQAFPEVRVTQATRGMLDGGESPGLLLLSHVIGELDEDARNALRQLCLLSEAILWVEPGSHDDSRQLGEEREQLRRYFRVLAPCTHQGACPMFLPENERHWCHSFAPPPPGIFGDPDWVRFGHRAGIDLRSLPYSFLALERRSEAEIVGEDAGLSRVIGRPESLKPSVRLLDCRHSGLRELNAPRRTANALCKTLERTRLPLVCRWEESDGKILAGGPIGHESHTQNPP